MTFLGLATPSQIFIFFSPILHNFTLVSKHVFSFFKVFIFLWIQCTKLKLCKWLFASITYIKQRRVKSESQPKDFYFSKEIFSGLIFCAAYVRTFEFWNVKNQSTSSQLLFLQVAFIARVKRYEFILFTKR